MDVNNPLKMVLIGIDPYPSKIIKSHNVSSGSTAYPPVISMATRHKKTPRGSQQSDRPPRHAAGSARRRESLKPGALVESFTLASGNPGHVVGNRAIDFTKR